MKVLEFRWKEEFLQVIDEYGLKKEDFCIVGGTVLSLHGIRPNTDVDFSLRKDILEEALYNSGKIESLKVVRNIIQTSDHTDIHVGRFQNIGISDDDLIGDPKFHRVVDGFKLSRLEVELVDRICVKYPKRKEDVLLIKDSYQRIQNWDWGLVIDLLLIRQEHILKENNLREELKLQARNSGGRLRRLLRKPWRVLRRAMGFSKKIYHAAHCVCTEMSPLSLKLWRGTIHPDVARQYYGDKLVFYTKVGEIERIVKIYVMINGKRVKPKRHFVLGGPWDEEAPYFAEDETCIDVVDMHVNNRHYKDTILYKRYLSRLKCGMPEIHHGTYLDTEEKLGEYFESFYPLFESLKRDGYQSQRELGGTEDTEIGVAIGRSGELLHFRTGHHRLAMVKVLDIYSVPVVVHLVHRVWLRRCVWKYKTLPSIAVRKGLEEMQRKGIVLQSGSGGDG